MKFYKLLFFLGYIQFCSLLTAFAQKKYEIYPSANFVSYDLEKELKKNPESIVKRILEQHYMVLNKINYYYDKNAEDYYSYKVKGVDSDGLVRTLNISWESFSDGEEWRFWLDELVRNTDEAFDIITDPEAKERIRKYMRGIESDETFFDVFLKKYHSFTENQKTKEYIKSLGESSHYGVYFNGTAYLFDLNGKFEGKE